MLCEKFNNLNPISLRQEDAEEVVILISRFTSYGKNKSESKEPTINNIENNEVRRKRVYADTATNGWYVWLIASLIGTGMILQNIII